MFEMLYVANNVRSPALSFVSLSLSVCHSSHPRERAVGERGQKVVTRRRRRHARLGGVVLCSLTRCRSCRAAGSSRERLPNVRATELSLPTERPLLVVAALPTARRGGRRGGKATARRVVTVSGSRFHLKVAHNSPP